LVAHRPPASVTVVITQCLALVQLWFALLLGGVRALRFLLKTPADRVRAGRRMLREYKEQAATDGDCLVPASEGLHQMAPVFLSHAEGLAQRPGIVIYFTGTGETPHAPLPAYRRLIAAATGLSGLRHYVVEAPWSRGAYYGSSAFSSRIWEQLLPLITREPGPFVFVGLSRGAVAALDTGARVAEEHGKVAAVLAMSPPFKLPQRLPASIVEVAKLEPVVERLGIWLPLSPSWAQQLVTRVVRRVHLLLTAIVHAELGMLAEEDFCYAVRDIELRGAVESSARAVREFRLLVEAPDRELDHFTSRVAAAAARTPRFFASLVWGEEDAWAPAAACHARLSRALVREKTPSDRVALAMLPGRGHGLFREHAHSVEPLAALLVRAQHEADARSRAQEARTDADRTFQQKLLQAPPGLPHD
jgi:hypothetical protein